MRRNRRKTFEELVNENKQQLLSDRDAIERIEERIERRYEMQLFKQAE
ncbi:MULTISPECIES: FbpB family small basic protein [Bacillus cereus group]|uniref:FbpB family small basic protein n=1 Tax=Bacillus cereus TaxID=1396 RepID=A0AA44QBC4_BACCE|nr:MULTISPECIES: FbpB family small basic protein [Bacillus cereus group]PFA22534.1 FbpB family small basic protein [Bacillus cereus]PFN06518.1 FbpB family small basic protein [Bacillus cereus]PFO84923.1 FbpB family small basic protein [Bacillus cereus]PFR24188.1 FbpB family small basic protein [Bacillus cereus]PFS01896.1 FbpB family small basic protein [Bacillus cereus]